MNSTILVKLNPCHVYFIKIENSLFNQISIYATLVVRQENWLKIEHVYICMIGNNSTNNAEFDLIRNGWN